MQVIRNPEILKGQALVGTIGFFDGVHLGHRFLINELKAVAASRNLPTAVITFPTHPRIILHADYQPKSLNTFEERMEHLAETGIDYCIIIDFDWKLSKYSAKEFITSVLAETWHINTLLIGYDHRFGFDRKDGFEQYVSYGKEFGIEVVEANSYSEGPSEVSSSEIRRLLSKCHVEKAGELLTYPYSIKGQIVNGYKVGRTLGFPTANIRPDEPNKIIPGIGIYAVWVDLDDNKRYKGMLYIGNRPTFKGDDEIVMEVHILGFTGDLYNKEITVTFVYHIRDDIKFNSPEALIEQLKKDQETVEKLL